MSRRVRQALVGADAAHASVSRPVAARDATKPDPMRRLAAGDEKQQRVLTRALEATLHQRQATLVYHSKASERTKTYHVHPYRLAYAQGGLYLLAYVPEYKEVRTFAVERVEDISLLEEHYTPIEELPDEAFPNSLGVHSGPPEHVEIEFDPGVADYVRARAWHHSQRIADRGDGGLQVALDVCLDRALTSWILSFGPFAKVRPESPRATSHRTSPMRRRSISDDCAENPCGRYRRHAARQPRPAALHKDAMAEAAASGVIWPRHGTQLSLHHARHSRARPLLTVIVNNGAVVKNAAGTLMRQLPPRETALHVLASVEGFDDSVAVVFDRGDNRQIVLETWTGRTRTGGISKRTRPISRRRPHWRGHRRADSGDVQRQRARGVWRRCSRTAQPSLFGRATVTNRATLAPRRQLRGMHERIGAGAMVGEPRCEPRRGDTSATT